MSSSVGAESTREQRRWEREERRRRRAQDSAKTSLTGEKTPGKEEKRTKRGSDCSSSNGGVSKKPPSGTKRSTMPSYDKVNIIERTAKFDLVEKENKGKQKTEVLAKPDSSRRKLGSKFLDNLSKFETQEKETDEVKKNPFVRSFSSHNHPPSSAAVYSTATDQPFRRSYRTPRTTPGIDDPSVLTRRSLRKERVLDSIAKLEKKSSTDPGTASKKKQLPAAEEKQAGKTKLSSRPNSASSSKASLSDSGSSTCSTKGMTRAQQALERHKERMRKSSQSSQNGSTPIKPTTPTGKCRSTPGKSKSRQKVLERTPSTEEPKTQKISISATPVKDDAVEVTTVTEVMTSSEGKMNIVVKEIAASEEESEKLLSPTEAAEYELGDPRPVSVEDAVAKFTEPPTPEVPEEKPKRVRRKLPEIPTDQPAKEPGRHLFRKKKRSEDGSGKLGVAAEEQKIVVIETSPTFEQSSESLELVEVQSPRSGGNFQYSKNFNENSNLDRKSFQPGQTAFMPDQNVDIKPESANYVEYEAVKDVIKRNPTELEDEALNRSYSPDEAIEVLRRLSEEIHSQPTVTKEESSVAKSSIVTSEVIIEESDNQDQSELSSANKFERQSDCSEKRPSSLHIEEVLYIAEDNNKRTDTTSPQKQLAEGILRNPSPSNFRKSSLKTLSRESSISQVSRTPSPQKSPTKLSQKSSFETPKAVTIEQTLEATSFERQGLGSSSEKQQKSSSKTPETAEKPSVHAATCKLSAESSTKIPTAPVKLGSPVKSPEKVLVSFSFKAESTVETKVSVQENCFSYPHKTKVPKSPIHKSVFTPAKSVEPPSKQEEINPTSLAKGTEVVRTSPLTQEPEARSPSPGRFHLSTKKSSDDKMLAARRTVVQRYQKSWLDESDDDNISLLSDADSDASSIDMDWLGQDASDDDDFERKKSLKMKSTSAGVQRTASSAQDMLKMWEKKATGPKHEVRNSATKLPSESVSRVGNVRAAWESKRKSTLRDSSQESVNSSEGKSNGHSHNGSTLQAKVRSSPSTPRHASSRTKSSVDEESLKSPSGGDWKPRASETEAQEMMDIFDDKVAGKIQGAKAMFENLVSSPKRSSSLGRSPVRRSEGKRLASETADDVFPSRKSSISQASESSDAAMPTDSSDLMEDSPTVDNMRAMFENKKGKKQDAKKHKTSSKEERKSKAQKSYIQKKVAARKKGRRSMTQPVLSEDVAKAHRDIMNEKSPKAQSDTDEQEEALNFVDRLKFFNQLAKTSPAKSRGRKRSDTQAPKFSQVHKTAELIEKNQTVKKKIEISKPPAKSPTQRLPPVDISSQQSNFTTTPLTSPRSPSCTVQKLTQKFSVTSSSDNESLLSSSSTSIDDIEPGRKKFLLSSSEDSSDMSVHVAECKTTGSIHDRLEKLQRNTADEKWRKSSSRNSGIKSSVGDRLNKLKSQEEKWKKPPPSAQSDFVSRAERLQDRIAKMQEDSKTWMEKSGKQNDAAQFTVQAKLAKKDGKKAVAVLPSPLMKRRVLPVVIPSHETSVTENDAKKNDDSSSMNQLSSVERLARKGLEENVIKKTEVKTIEVPTFDDEEFEKFFGISTMPSALDEIVTNGYSEIELDIENFPEVENTTRLSDIGRFKSGLKQPNKRGSSKRNPLKALAQRTDLKQSYDTERSNVAKLEQQRIAQRGYGANFTAAAIAGLAAKADLKKVNLRSTKNTPMPSSDDLKPFKDVMLLRAKGRRQVQTRLVEPRPSSLCSDDAYLLVTPNKLYGWFGEFCNVIERAKINEIADYIVIKGDLGCKVSALKTIEENANKDMHRDFWKTLGGFDDWDRTTSPGGDEHYEADVEATIKTYKMIDSKLVPHEDAWGKFPKMAMLGSKDTYVFDFGAEMYIWQGKEVSFADRRLAVRLARVLWEQEYDYTEQGISPFHSKELKGKRPEYGLFARVNENLETSLFQEKFPDWSNIHREIGQEEATMREMNRGKTIKENENKSAISSEMETCDVIKMRKEETPHTSLLIEGHDVAQGDGDIIDEDGRILEIVTSGVEHYFINDNKIEKLPDSILHRENSYVIKWNYSISSTGRFTGDKLEKSSLENGGSGRQRVAFFSWTGPDSLMTDKGASALIATNMDTDEGPVINLHEATAPLVFNKCFHGNMVVMNGKRGVKRGAFSWKLFKVRGHSEESAALVEVPCECKSLRSCSSFVTMMPREATAIVWHGCRSPKNVRESAEEAIKKMSERMPESIPFRRTKTSIEISVCEEGQETDQFWEAIGIKRRNRYECLVDVDTPTVVTRAWKFDIRSDVFVGDELKPVEHYTLFPLVQELLTEIEKPCMILVDSTHGVFLWQNADSERLGGSAKRRWDVIRRLSMETAIKYCKEHNREEGRLVEIGTEPASLTNAFPSWGTKEKSTIDKLLPQKHKLVSEVLSTLTRMTYSIEELRGKDLPDGVDASHLESYLSNSDFEKLFEMTKKEFYKLPTWKQKKIRQQNNFF